MQSDVQEGEDSFKVEYAQRMIRLSFFVFFRNRLWRQIWPELVTFGVFLGGIWRTFQAVKMELNYFHQSMPETLSEQLKVWRLILNFGYIFGVRHTFWAAKLKQNPFCTFDRSKMPKAPTGIKNALK